MSSASTDNNMVAVGTAKPVVKGTSKEDYPNFVTAVKTTLTFQGALSMLGDKPRFDGGPEPNSLHYGKSKGNQSLVTEEHLEDIPGLRDEGFQEGDILLDGLARGKFASAWREHRAKAKMAISKFLLLVENGSPLYVVMERASRSGDPNKVIAAAELFYNSKTFPTLLSIIHGEERKKQDLKERKKLSTFESYTQLRQIFRDSRRNFIQVFSDEERSDPDKRVKIDELWQFCRQIAVFEDWFGEQASLLNFISLNVRQSRENPIDFDISDFWESFDQHASVSRADDSNKKQKPSTAEPAVTPKESKEIANLKKHIAILGKSKGRNQKSLQALGLARDTFKRKSDHSKTDSADREDTKKPRSPCFAWRDKGKCKYGSSCRFEHDGAKATVNAFSVPMATDESDWADYDEPYSADLAMFSGIEDIEVEGYEPQPQLYSKVTRSYYELDDEVPDEPVDIFTVGSK